MHLILRDRYFAMDELIAKMREPQRSRIQRIYDDNKALFMTAQGSSHNHHNWKGGYHDHVTEVMNWAVVLYQAICLVRSQPFTLSEALVVLFLHDIEKPWRFSLDAVGELVLKPDLESKADRKVFRNKKIQEYGLDLSPAQENAMLYVEGENEDYSPKRRAMRELAAFCHMCDVWSARGQYNYPADIGDPWKGAKRCS